MNKSTILLAVTWALILAAIAFAGGYFTRKLLFPQEPPIVATDTVWRWHTDTIILRESKPAGSVIAVLPVARPDTISVSQVDTLIVRDSVAVEVPIEQRTYEGEYYKAVVQGFRPELVAIDIRLPEITVPKRKRWAVTVGPQVGYGFTPAGWQPYAGVGATFGYTF